MIKVGENGDVGRGCLFAENMLDVQKKKPERMDWKEDSE